MGSPDDLKLRSSMTLFDEVTDSTDRFGEVLEVFYEGQRDAKTIEFLSRKE